MSVWAEAFIVIAAIALVVQMLIMLGMFLTIRPAVQRFERIASDFQTRVDPILASATRILADSEDRIKSIMNDAAEITQTARSEAQKVDRVLTDAIERLRLQVIRADQVVTGALEAVEEAGTKVRQSILTPVHQFSALLKGIKVGLDVIRGHRPPHSDGVPQDEELFI
jgi:hypothetical protein